MKVTSPPTNQSYLVIGGSGFLGRHIVETLVGRGEKNVYTFDIVQRYHDVAHYTGDITDPLQITDVIKKTGTKIIIHTASPVHNLPSEIYYKVNVVGTLTVAKAAIANGVKCLVYTSSSGVVEAGINIIDADERMPYPDKFLDAYNESKALGEKIVLEANGRGGLLTVALRPAGIFGPGDRQVIPNFAQALANGQTHFQIGDNTNIFDMTYIDNVVYAHIVAADRLWQCTKQKPSEWRLTRDAVFDTTIQYSDRTIGTHRLPTSEAKPLGPVRDRALNDAEKKAEQLFRSPDYQETRAITRTKFDPLSDSAMQMEKIVTDDIEKNSEVVNGHLEPPESPFLPEEDVSYDANGTSLPHPSSIITPNLLQVPGQAFFITNGEPVYFWDFGRMVWSQMGDEGKRRRIVMGKSIGLVVGSLAEWFSWLMGREAGFTRFRVGVVSNTRWFNIEKARRVLGYEPQVGLEEGIKRAVEWFNEQGGLAAHKH